MHLHTTVGFRLIVLTLLLGAFLSSSQTIVAGESPSPEPGNVPSRVNTWRPGNWYIGMSSATVLSGAMNYYYHTHNLFGLGPSGRNGGFDDPFAPIVLGIFTGFMLTVMPGVAVAYQETIADPKNLSKPTLAGSAALTGFFLVSIECAKALIHLASR